MKKTLLVLTLLLAGSLAACGKSPTTPQASPSASTSPTATQSSGGTSTTKVDAQAVFKANCVSCHGVNLEGAVGPNLQKVGSKLSKDQVSTTITNGKGAMPSFKGKLSDDEVSSLATWLADKK
ncbi:c-type cytochrome [Paenibacillus planticolens]|uniref:C-type cytochrome n=1 Tax=Paenibacillus planticolens TaxID=2654976 RepID=A0ABX1ZX91_9BACL|nr:cytochrome c [Paenibacillus planticolens]NOV04303.1 c-type cytochrome [Paenibacillus planticolens]